MGEISVRPALAGDSQTIKCIERNCGLSDWNQSDYQSAADSDEWIILVAEVDGHVAGFILTRLITKPNQIRPRTKTPKKPSISRSQPPLPPNIPKRTSTETRAEAELCNLGVKRKYRKSGIGRKLLERSIAYFKETKAFSIFLEVRASNTGAVRFYENNGFLRISRRPGYYDNPREDALTMKFTAKNMRKKAMI